MAGKLQGGAAAFEHQRSPPPATPTDISDEMENTVKEVAAAGATAQSVTHTDAGNTEDASKEVVAEVITGNDGASAKKCAKRHSH